MSRVLLSFILLTAISCSTGYHIPESFEEKMARYQEQHRNTNLVPQLKILPFQHLSSRSPASIKHLNQDFARGYSNKRLYFLTLYTQYNKLTSFSNSKAPRIQICPSFNTSVQKDIEQFPPFGRDEKLITQIEAPASKGYSNHQIAIFPELALPMVKNDIYPTVADIAATNPGQRQDLLKQALDIHIAKTYSELTELCQTGSSDNYYIFENLYAHIKAIGSFKATPENLQILYKTTLFANQSLLYSLKRNKREIASVKPREIYINELMSRFEVEWFQNYLHNISKK